MLLPQRLLAEKLILLKPTVMYWCISNEGAEAVAEMVQDFLPQLQLTNHQPKPLRDALDERSQSARDPHFVGSPGMQSPTPLQPSERDDGPEANTTAVFLLYLNDKTFSGRNGERLSDELRAALKAKVQILMLHENDTKCGGCEVSVAAYAQRPCYTAVLE